MKRSSYIMPALLLALLMMGNTLEAQKIHWRSSGPDFSSGMGHQERFRIRRGGRRAMRIRRDKDHLSAAKMWMLTDELDLTEAQAAKVFPRMKGHETALQEFGKKRRDLIKAYHKKVQDEKASTRDTERFVDELTKLDKQRLDAKAKFIKGMKDVLDAQQLATFAVFEEHSRNKLRNRLMGMEFFIEMDRWDDDD